MNKSDIIIGDIITTWNEHFGVDINERKVSDFAQQMKIMDQIGQSNLLTVAFSFEDLSILHINDAAADFFGGTPSDFRQAGAQSIISCFDETQLNFAIHAATISAPEVAKSSREDIIDSYTCYANWIVNNKRGVSHRSLFRIFPVLLNSQNKPLAGMYLIHDITPFLNPGVWWYRSSVGNRDFMCYQSEEEKFKRKDLLSNREKSVLKLISEGFTSKEIGKQLFLSQHTIDNHRRRMFAKTGAVDSSALVHVAKLSGII